MYYIGIQTTLKVQNPYTLSHFWHYRFSCRTAIVCFVNRERGRYKIDRAWMSIQSVCITVLSQDAVCWIDLSLCQWILPLSWHLDQLLALITLEDCSRRYISLRGRFEYCWFCMCSNKELQTEAMMNQNFSKVFFWHPVSHATSDHFAFLTVMVRCFLFIIGISTASTYLNGRRQKSLKAFIRITSSLFYYATYYATYFEFAKITMLSFKFSWNHGIFLYLAKYKYE